MNKKKVLQPHIIFQKNNKKNTLLKINQYMIVNCQVIKLKF